MIQRHIRPSPLLPLRVQIQLYNVNTELGHDQRLHTRAPNITRKRGVTTRNEQRRAKVCNFAPYEESVAEASASTAATCSRGVACGDDSDDLPNNVLNDVHDDDVVGGARVVNLHVKVFVQKCEKSFSPLFDAMIRRHTQPTREFDAHNHKYIHPSIQCPASA